MMRDDAYRETAGAYLSLLGLSTARREAVGVALDEGSRTSSVFAAFHDKLSGRSPGSANPAFASLRARLHRALPGGAQASGLIRTDSRGDCRLVTTPTLVRTPMGPRDFRGHDPESPGAARKPWYHVANRRRVLLLSLVIGLTWLATSLMSAVLPYHGQQPLEFAILVLFAILFTWVALGFFTAMAGFVLLLAGRDRFSISRTGARTPCAQGCPARHAASA